jgi:hypothetical protein
MEALVLGRMKNRSVWSNPIARNIVGVLILLLAWYLPDRFFFTQREGFQKFVPYLLLLTMYAWIVIHNRMLLERLYLAGKRKLYFLWTGVLMTVASANVFLTIRVFFDNRDPVPQILGLWVFTIAGAGIYLLFRYRSSIMQPRPAIVRDIHQSEVTRLDFAADGRQYSLDTGSIFYIESLENYIRIVTDPKPLLVRMSLKEAEQKLSPGFIRISRSHLVNSVHIGSFTDDSIMVAGRELKIGKVYKKYVKELIG